MILPGGKSKIHKRHNANRKNAKASSFKFVSMFMLCTLKFQIRFKKGINIWASVASVRQVIVQSKTSN